MDPTIMGTNNIINRTIPKLIITAFAVCVLTTHGLSITNDSLRFEVLMSSKMLNNIHIDINLINSIDITSDRFILLSSNNQFYVLGWGGIIPFGEKVAGKISSYAFTPDSLLMTIRDKEICTFDSTGNLSKLFKLPNAGMGISAGKNVMYLYDRVNPKSKYALYILVRGGKYVMLFEVPSPILSLVEMDNLILFSTKNALYSLNPKNKALKTIAALPNDQEIKSITVDTLNNRLYFSSDNMVYTLKDSSTRLVSDQFGGILRYDNGGLIVFNSEKKFLVRITGLEDKITSMEKQRKIVSGTKPATDILTNESIINLVKENLSDELIIKIINKSEVNFNVGIDSMIELSNQKVSSAVISAMKSAMKKKTSVPPQSSF